MNPTTIEWVRNLDGSQGLTSNPFTGCLGPKSDGIRCPYCYAWIESFGRCKQADLRGTPIELPWNHDPFYPRFHPERLQQIKGRQKPAGIFLCDRSDFAAAYWPREWQAQLWDMIAACPQHRFYLLTHQPQELPKFSPYPDNCWVGVTVTNYEEYLGATGVFCRVPLIKAEVKFLSIEPLLSWRMPMDHLWLMHAGIGWIIIGAMTGRRHQLWRLHHWDYPDLTLMRYGEIWTLQPKLEWILDIAEAADKAAIPVFLKLNLVPMIADSYDPAKLKLYPDGYHLRQEVPG